MAAVIGAGHDGGQRKLVLHQMGDPGGILGPVDADQDQPRLGRTRRVQDVEPRAVTVEHLEPHQARDADHLGVGVDDRHRIAPREQRLARHLAKAAKPDEQDVAAQAVRCLDPVHVGRGRAPCAVVQDDEQRRQHHRHDDDRGQHRIVGGRDEANRQRSRVQDKGELAALGHQDRALQRLCVRGTERTGDAVDDERLEDQEPGDGCQHQPPLVHDHGQVQRHAHGKEEQPEEQAAERFHVGFQLVAEGGFGQKHARKERPHRRRQPARLQQKRRPQHDQQCSRRHHLARAGLGQDAEHRIQQVAPRDDQPRDAREPDGDAGQPVGERHGLAPRGQERDQRQERHDGKVFEEQDRHDALPLWGRERAALAQHLHDDGGRGQDEPGPRDQRRCEGEPQRHAHHGQRGHGGQDLHEPQPEDVAPHRPQARGLHFQTDDEQEHHHAQLGDVQHGHGVREQAKPVGPDGQPRGEVAQHRPQPQPLEQGHGDDGRSQQDDH